MHGSKNVSVAICLMLNLRLTGLLCWVFFHIIAFACCYFSRPTTVLFCLDTTLLKLIYM